tara:strand:- start:444 stop:875 length:432 start_codon:yes stop_codon:yes gene_type:complete
MPKETHVLDRDGVVVSMSKPCLSLHVKLELDPSTQIRTILYVGPFSGEYAVARWEQELRRHLKQGRLLRRNDLAEEGLSEDDVEFVNTVVVNDTQVLQFSRRIINESENTSPPLLVDPEDIASFVEQLPQKIIEHVAGYMLGI